MRIILHIGLHKTGSTFLQWEVFSRFDDDKEILYNPNLFLKSLSKIVYLEKRYNEKLPEDERIIYIEENKRILNHILTDKNYSKKKKILLISWESLSQNLFLLNHEEHFSIIREIFQDCEIIVFLRYQTDFILSIYRQLIHGDRLTSIKDFLNFRDGEFKSSINSDTPNIDINKIDYYELLQCYINNYGRDNVHIYFYEYFNKKTVESICEILQVDMPRHINFNRPVNRGYSALSIHLTFLKARVCRWLKIGPKKHSDRKPLEVFNMGWKEACQQKNFFFLLPFFFYKVYWVLYGAARSPLGSWRGFIQKVFDKIIYIDWDLLEKSGVKTLLDNKFKHDNLKLLQFIDREDIPKKYFG